MAGKKRLKVTTRQTRLVASLKVPKKKFVADKDGFIRKLCTDSLDALHLRRPGDDDVELDFQMGPLTGHGLRLETGWDIKVTVRARGIVRAISCANVSFSRGLLNFALVPNANW